ncbi:MAG: type II toxin-antitoxin system VapC family toxin [Alphaproteobacteria bacterium]|nr:type II toxin-antitoxin system VapC family toxin [Alphaproteobacteria bacterium]
MIVLDSSALIAVFSGEPEGERFREILVESDETVIGVATLLETRMVIASRYGEAGAAALHRLLDVAAVSQAPLGRRQGDLAYRAFLAFGRGSGHPARLNFSDCLSYALAKSLEAPLLFKGDDFRRTDIAVA